MSENRQGTLLDRVIDGASGDAPVAQLLRQLKVLASRMGTTGLEAWVDHELNGYPEDVDVPQYRGPFAIRPLGHFVGAGGSTVENVEIPPSSLPRQMRDGQLFHRIFDEPIATIEQWATQEFTTFAWPLDFVPVYRHMVSTGEIKPLLTGPLVLAEVRYHVGNTTFVEISGAVRTKILNLALELEQVAPLAGDRDIPTEQAAPGAQVINNHFHAPASLSIGGNAVQVVVDVPAAGDTQALVRYLAAAGLPTKQIVELEELLQTDLNTTAPITTPANGETPRARWPLTRGWFAKAATDTTTGALGDAISAAATGFLG